MMVRCGGGQKNGVVAVQCGSEPFNGIFQLCYQDDHDDGLLLLLNMRLPLDDEDNKELQR